MIKTTISIQKLKIDLQQIVGKEISRAWKGFGSALFLELGNIHNELAWKKEGEPAISVTGEWTLSSEGAWKLVRNNAVLINTETASSEKIKKIIKNFEGLLITSIDMNTKQHMLSVNLSNKDTIEFHKASYGFFTLLSNEKPYISYEDNAPYMQHAIV